MKTVMKNHTIGAGIIAVAAVLLFSCNQNPVGIFATIESTDAIDLDTAMPDNAMVRAIAEFGQDDSATEHHLLAATGLQLLQRPLNLSDDSSQWTGTVFPKNQSYVATFVVHARSGNGDEPAQQVFAIFGEKSSDDSETIITSLFRTPVSAITQNDFSADDWHRVAIDTAGSLDSLLSTESDLFISSRVDKTYTLYRLTHDGNTWKTEAADLNDTPAEEDDSTEGLRAQVVTAVELDTKTYILTKNRLYTIDSNNVLTPVADVPEESESEEDEEDTPSIILTDAAVINNTLVVTTSQGFVYYKTENSWEQSKVLDEENPVRLQSIASVPMPDDAERLILVGTRSTGLAHLTDSFTLQNLREGDIDHINYGGSELSRISVERFMIPTQGSDSEQLIFAGSGGNGLWRGTVRNSSTIRWGRE